MSSDEGEPKPPTPRFRVLFVEDEPALRSHLAQVLSDEYSVETAGTGTEALKAVMRAKPDLIVTDIVMPEMDGVEMLKTLRSVPSTQAIPVLLISGMAPEDRRIEGFRVGADGYLAKPYSERELRALIGSMLQSARLRAEAVRRETVAQAEQRALSDRAALLESITDAFYALDRHWRYTYVNQHALDFYGKTREELLGRSFWEVFPVASGTALQQQLERALATQCSLAFEIVSPVTGRWVDMRAYPTGQGLAVHFRDVSARKRAEAELRAALDALRDSDRRKDEFLALLSHELRNPLGPITHGLAALKRRVAPEPMIQETLGIMERQLNLLVHLVNDLLDVGRITHGKLELRIERVLLTDVLRNVMEATRPVVEAQRHECTAEVRAPDLVVDGDPDRLTQVFANLIHNSAKYTDPGGQIRLTVDRRGDHAVIAVTDNGVGIPENALEQVFEMFSQLRSHQQRSGGGLGIGLALVRTLVRMHGGTISVASAGPGTGSTFTVLLPLAAAAVAERAETTRRDTPIAAEGDRRILIVDDNADAATSLATILQLNGYLVSSAASGEQAIERARAFRPQIILMDIGLPGIDGVEAARQIRAIPEMQDVRIIALTGWGQPADRARTHDAGMVAHLVKPVAPESLQEILARLGSS